MTEKVKKITKRYLPQSIIGGCIVIVFLLSLILFLAMNNTKRREFLFPSAEDNGSLVIEYRNLSKDAVQGDVQYFIDELLLGSSVERTRMLFTPGTKVISCFERDKKLILNLSNDLVQMGPGVISIREGVDLLKKNIQTNFPRIEEVELYVDGNFAFEK